MSYQPNMNQSSSSGETRNSLPANPSREYVAVIECPVLDRLADWISGDLEQLLERNANFESPSSCRKYFSR